ncbi:AzlD domain-containing protein [Alicyclobacillus curvatus]|nr:AzlD domain-containing protein [Alicyclobacillus curvatus]
MRNIPIGIFVAKIAPSILNNSYVQGHTNWAFISATAVSLITAWSTKKPLLTMLSGVIVLAAIRMFF